MTSPIPNTVTGYQVETRAFGTGIYKVVHIPSKSLLISSRGEIVRMPTCPDSYQALAAVLDYREGYDEPKIRPLMERVNIESRKEVQLPAESVELMEQLVSQQKALEEQLQMHSNAVKNATAGVFQQI